MITSLQMLSFFKETFKTYCEIELKNDIQIYCEEEELKSIIDDTEIFIKGLNDFVKDEVNTLKKASAFELIIRHRCPFKVMPENIEEEIRINTELAFSTVLLLLFEKRNIHGWIKDMSSEKEDSYEERNDTEVFDISTQRPKTLDEPMMKSLENHMIWLKKSNFNENNLPIFLNAEYWNLYKIVYDNQDKFSIL